LREFGQEEREVPHWLKEKGDIPPVQETKHELAQKAKSQRQAHQKVGKINRLERTMAERGNNYRWQGSVPSVGKEKKTRKTSEGQIYWELNESERGAAVW